MCVSNSIDLCMDSALLRVFGESYGIWAVLDLGKCYGWHSGIIQLDSLGNAHTLDTVTDEQHFSWDSGDSGGQAHHHITSQDNVSRHDLTNYHTHRNWGAHDESKGILEHRQ